MLTIELHSGPTGQEWQAFVAECNNPKSGDGAARTAGIPPTVVAALQDAQPAPSPLPATANGGVR